ncbi:MAG: alpha/beta fold hydrolase [Lautropia sp.]
MTQLNVSTFGNGPPLVMLHGFVGGSGFWVAQQAGMGDRLRLICIDLPGFAGSAGVPAPDSLSGYAQTVVDRLAALGVTTFSLLGFSMGGMIAQQLTRDHPDRVRSLILYGSAAVGDLPHRFESWEASIGRLERDGVDATTEKTVGTWFVDGTAHPFHDACLAACRGADKASCIRVMRAMQGWSSLAWLKEIRIPTLVIVGDKDRSTKPSDSVLLWEGIPGAEFCVLPNCAHGAHMENPDLFNRVVSDFVFRARAAGTAGAGSPSP